MKEFSAARTLEIMETLRQPSGGFIAAPTADYSAVWIRDHLYMVFAYFYLGDYEKCAEGVRLVFNIFHTHRHKLERVLYPENLKGDDLIHAKFRPDTTEITLNWGHFQLDAIGLFLHIVADLDFKNVRVIRDKGDQEVLQLLVFYVLNLEYWLRPDNGMWEEHPLRKSSSIGAVVGGLSYVQRRGLAVVPNELVTLGRNELNRILPYESRDACNVAHHKHDCDAAQLSLIWPFNVVSTEMADVIVSRIANGHRTDQGEWHCLMQKQGVNRYWGDDYMRSANGISAEWQWEFWLAIVFAQKHDRESLRAAFRWFERGAGRITPEGAIAEAFVNGAPNEHTPLGWMHALALIAWSKILAKLGIHKEQALGTEWCDVKERIEKIDGKDA